MLNALTIRERRLLLGILAILLLGAMVKWWRWRDQQIEKVESTDNEEVVRIGNGGRVCLPPGVAIIGDEFPSLAA